MRPGDYPVLYEEIFDEVIAKIEQGDTIEKAMVGSGHNSRTFYNWLKNRPAWRERYAEARQVHAQVNADRVDSRVEELVMKEDPAPSTVALWAKRHNPAYRERNETSIDVDVSVGGSIQVEGRHVVGIADIIRLARETGQEHLLGLHPGDSGGELPPAQDVLPDSPGRERAAGDVPAAGRA